jgi:predicted nucleotidyltransferase
MTEEGARFDRTLFAAVDTLETAQIPHALIGGVAASGMGRPRSTHDIDFFVRPEDADAVLEALAHNGFSTEKTDIRWLFKAWRENILVDIIFKSHGDIYFDEEMNQRACLVNYHGRKVRAVSPEDLIIIKCAVSNEGGPHHWHDALALLSHANLDWDYLVKRARRASKRVLALLVYAQSADILVPSATVFEMFKVIYGEEILRHFFEDRRDSLGATPSAGAASASLPLAPNAGSGMGLTLAQELELLRMEPDEYVAGRIKDELTRDERTGAQDVKVLVSNRRVILKGEALSENHREAVSEVVRGLAPGFELDNQLRVRVLPGPEGAEEIA